MRHDHPRFISVNGTCIKEQLVRDTPLEHEVCSLIVRTMVLSDKFSLYHGMDLWRIFFEPDLSVSTFFHSIIVQSIVFVG